MDQSAQEKSIRTRVRKRKSVDKRVYSLWAESSSFKTLFCGPLPCKCKYLLAMARVWAKCSYLNPLGYIAPKAG